MGKKKKNKRRDRYLESVVGLQFFERDGALRADVLEKLDWSLKNLVKEDRVLWFLGIIRRYHLACWSQIEPAESLPGKENKKRLSILRDFGISRIVEDYEGLIASFIPNWDHYKSLSEIHDSRVLRKLPFNRREKGKQIPISVEELMLNLRTAEEGLVKNASGRYCKDGIDFLTMEDGWKWVRVEDGYSREEARAMGHCGNGAGKPGDVLYSLREPIMRKDRVFWRPHLTFICKRSGFFGEMKGRANGKPSSVYNERITGLLKKSDFRGVRGGGYLPENNFDISELTSEQLAEIISANPRFQYSDYRFDEVKVIHRFDDGWDLAFYSGTTEPERPQRTYEFGDSVPKLIFRRIHCLRTETIEIPCLSIPYVKGYLGPPTTKFSSDLASHISTKFKTLLNLVDVRGVSSGSITRADCPWLVLLGNILPQEIIRCFPRFASATPIPELVERFGPGPHLAYAISLKIGFPLDYDFQEKSWELVRFRSVSRFLESIMDYPTLRLIRNLKQGNLRLTEKSLLKRNLLHRIHDFQFGQDDLKVVVKNSDSLGSPCSIAVSENGLAAIGQELDFSEIHDVDSLIQQLVRTYDYDRMPASLVA